MAGLRKTPEQRSWTYLKGVAFSALFFFFFPFFAFATFAPSQELEAAFSVLGIQELSSLVREHFSPSDLEKLQAIARLVTQEASQERLCRFVTAYIYSSQRREIPNRLRIHFTKSVAQEGSGDEMPALQVIRKFFRDCHRSILQEGEGRPGEMVLNWGSQRVTLAGALELREEIGREIAAIAENHEKTELHVLLAGMREKEGVAKVADHLTKGVATPQGNVAKAIRETLKESVVGFAKASQSAVYIGVKVSF